MGAPGPLPAELWRGCGGGPLRGGRPLGGGGGGGGGGRG